MFETEIKILSPAEAYAVTANLVKVPCDIDVLSKGRHHIADGKSLLGLLSLDLSKPVYLRAYTDTPEVIELIKVLMAPFSIQRKEED